MKLLKFVQYEPSTRPFQCDWDSCNKSFNRKSDLRRHYRTHTNERPYSCSIPGCGRSFIQNGGLTVHIRTHTGEKPYQCQHVGCDKRFCDSSALSRHRRIHTGKRQYKCAHDVCTKSFCRKATMAKHQRRSHQRDLYLNKLLDDCSSDSDMGEAPLTPTQTASLWPVSTVVPVQPIPQSHHLMYCDASFPDFGQQMHQYGMQKIGDCSIQQLFYVVEKDYVVDQGNSGVATMNTNMQPYGQASQQTQANAEHYLSQAEAEQFHTVDQHDLAFKGYGEAFHQDDVCVVEPEDKALYGCNMDATVAEYLFIPQTAKYDFTQMRDTLISPICPYTSESVAHLADGTQCLDQYAAPAGNWNGSFISAAVCY